HECARRGCSEESCERAWLGKNRNGMENACRILSRCRGNEKRIVLASRRLQVARHFESETGHAWHLARPREQSHPADVEVAQDLRPDAVVAQVHLDVG